MPPRVKNNVSKSVMKSKTKKQTVADLFKRGRCDKSLVKKATQMSKEEWQKHQKGMAEKWPLPEYMNGVKGHMAFNEETFGIVTRWTAKTKIAYRPHAKAPGSKSHLRYEKYSKAKTVGDALKLGSYPQDWCWDLERGFIKVLGGVIREEPLDISKVSPSQLTDVDTAIHTWYKRELARSLGIPVADLSEHQGHGESLAMRGQRLLAQKEAVQRLEAADKEGRMITDDEVLKTLQRWAFYRNPWRQNVMPKGQEWVFSDTLGLLRDRIGDIHLTAPTRRYPQVAELLARWLTERLPEEAKGFKFTSMNLNCNYAAKMHRDQGNFGPSFIAAFGEFEKGRLSVWPEDEGGSLDKVPKNKKIPIDIRSNLALFNGNCAHEVENFTGDRYSIVFFTVGCYASATEETTAKLKQLGLPVPSASEDRYALLRAPRGYSEKGGSSKSKLPSYRTWQRAALNKKKPRKTKNVAMKRLAPENNRSFYGKGQRGNHRGRKQTK